MALDKQTISDLVAIVEWAHMLAWGKRIERLEAHYRLAEKMRRWDEHGLEFLTEMIERQADPKPKPDKTPAQNWLDIPEQRRKSGVALPEDIDAADAHRKANETFGKMKDASLK